MAKINLQDERGFNQIFATRRLYAATSDQAQ